MEKAPFPRSKESGAEALTSRAEIKDGPGRDSSVGIATRYGLDGLGIESRWGASFSAPIQTGRGPTQPSIQWVPSLSRG